MTLDPEFPSDNFEAALRDEMSELIEELDRYRDFDWDWRRLKRALLRWIEAGDESFDAAAIEQEHDE